MRYDVIVVGARCAGSPTAMLLAQNGYRVLLIERGSLPSDTLSTHYIHPTGVARLKRWGILRKLIASNCPLIPYGTVDFGAFKLRGTAPPFDGVRQSMAPRRFVLDKMLADAAVEAGAELREQFTVEDLLTENDAVTGIRGRTSSGRNVTERARMVIGADGRKSHIAQCVHAVKYEELPPLTFAYFAYYSGMPLEGVELHVRPRCGFATFPTHDGQTVIFAALPHAGFDEFRADVEGNFLRALDVSPELAERVRLAHCESRIAGTADLPNFFRKPYGPGWALVGDAGYHKDPLTAHGISDAFRDAELLAEALDYGLSGRTPLMSALAEYERRRNRAAMPLYRQNADLASLEPPPPEMLAMFSALQGNEEQIDSFIGTLSGTFPVEQFYAPENVAQILGGSLTVATSF